MYAWSRIFRRPERLRAPLAPHERKPADPERNLGEDMKRLAITLCGVVCCAGCDRTPSGPDLVDMRPDMPSASPGGALATPRSKGVRAGISAAYLAGPWCYLYWEAGGERSDERIDYVFKRDGTLVYQNNPGSPVDRGGSWTLDGEDLSVGPAIWTVATRIDAAYADRFVLGDDRAQAVFARGACEREATP